MLLFLYYFYPSPSKHHHHNNYNNNNSNYNNNFLCPSNPCLCLLAYPSSVLPLSCPCFSLPSLPQHFPIFPSFLLYLPALPSSVLPLPCPSFSCISLLSLPQRLRSCSPFLCIPFPSLPQVSRSCFLSPVAIWSSHPQHSLRPLAFIPFRRLLPCSVASHPSVASSLLSFLSVSLPPACVSPSSVSRPPHWLL